MSISSTDAAPVALTDETPASGATSISIALRLMRALAAARHRAPPNSPLEAALAARPNRDRI